jgi:NitT/TauT family transport system permease protein
VNGLLSGVDQVPPLFRRVGTVLGAGRIQQSTLIVLPAALPGYLGGLKQGWAFSWRSLMAAEIITTGGTMGFGLGTLLDQNRQLADIAGVFVAILSILAIGILVELLVFAPIERRLARSRGLAPGGTR